MPAFMKLGDIKGESTEKDHKDWILIESMAWGINKSSPSPGGPPGYGPQAFTVTKEIDKSSPKLLEAACGGKVFPKVEFHSYPSGDGRAPSSRYVKIELWDCVISSVNMAGRSDEPPIDQISLSFAGAQMQVGGGKEAVVGKCTPAEPPDR